MCTHNKSVISFSDVSKDTQYAEDHKFNSCLSHKAKVRT